MFRDARLRLRDQRRGAAAMEFQGGRHVPSTWRTIVDRSPYLYHFTHTSTLVRIAREGLVDVQSGIDPERRSCVFLSAVV